MPPAASPVARECSDLDEFLSVTRKLCQSDPGQNTRVIANSQFASATRAKGGALTQLRMAVIEQSAVLQGGGITDALGALGVSDMSPESAAALGNFLKIRPDFANGLAGPTAVVHSVLMHAKLSYTIKFNLMLHELIDAPNRGRNLCATRIATSSDQALLVDWVTAFLREMNDSGPSSDLTTLASNTAYQRVGYRFISDHQQVELQH